MLNLWFTAGYAVLGSALVVLELIGVARKGDGDTITANWRWIDANVHGPLRWVWRVFTIGLLGWVAFHFGGNWS